MRNWLKGKTVMLTGASGGIGRELCKLLVQKYGATVIGIGRNEEKMRSLQTELGDKKENFTYRLFDVGDKAAWQAFADWLKTNDIHPQILINNAGAFPSFRKVENTPSDVMENIMQTNYFSVVYATETMLPILTGDEKDRTAVVNISSSAALCSVVGTAAYSASKAALKGYTECLQMEEKGRRYVGAIYPGTTATELFRGDANTKNSALDIIAMPAEKMAKKIARKIVRKKKRAVLGWDAKLMNLTAKIAPVKGLALICRVMRVSKSKVFTEVFKD